MIRSGNLQKILSVFSQAFRVEAKIKTVNLSQDQKHIDQRSLDLIIQLKDQLLPCHVPEQQRATAFQRVSLSDVYCSSKKRHSPHPFHSAMFMGLSSLNVCDSSMQFHHSVAVARLSMCKMCHVQVCPLLFLVILGRS